MRHVGVSLVLALVAWCGCAQEAQIADGACGNGVLDPGEDCDRPGTACTTACRIVCVAQPPCQQQMPKPSLMTCPVPTLPSSTVACTASDAIDGTCCPTSMACGTDGICHAPAGLVSTADLALSFDASAFLVADIDGDFVQDVIGTSETAVEVRYGALQSPLGTLVSTPAAAPTTTSTPIAFGDFDGDGRSDVVIPTAGGLFAFDSASGAPQPVAFPVNGVDNTGADPGIVPGVTHERLAALSAAGGTVAAIIELDYVASPAPGAGVFGLQLISTPTAITTALQFTPIDVQPTLCSVTSTFSLRGHGLHVFGDGSTLRVPVAIGDSKVEVCVATANPSAKNVGASYAIAKASLPAGLRVASGDGETLFASLMGNACPDLVLPVEDTNDTAYSLILPGSGTANADACSVDMLAADAKLVPGHPLAAIVVAMIPARPGLITSAGIFTYDGGVAGWTARTTATRTWRYAAVADLDGDGLDDFAAMTSGTDVEVFRQLPGGLLVPQWSDFLIPTQNSVTAIALGNFDGDRAGDVAIATTDLSSPLVPQPADLSIAFGNTDATYALVDFGTITEPTALAATNLYDASLPVGLDSCDDLVLARGGANPANNNDPNDPAVLVAEYGSTTRSLDGPFVYVSAFGGTTPERTQATAAVVGRFGANNTPGVFAVFTPLGSATTTTMTQVSSVNLTYDPSIGTFTSSPETVASSCQPAQPDGDIPFCLATAEFIVMRRDSGGDVLLALRRDTDAGPRTQCMEYALASSGAPNLQPIACSELAPAAASSTDPAVMAAYAGLTTIDRIVVLGNDGTTERLMLTTSPGSTHTSDAFVWELSITPAGLPQLANPISLDAELEGSGALPANAKASCFAGGSLELGTRTAGGTVFGANANELVVACSIGTPVGSGALTYDTQIWSRYADPGGGSPHDEMLWDMKKDEDITVKTGDVNGDGLVDLVFTFGVTGSGARDLHVLLQCDTHDTECGS